MRVEIRDGRAVDHVARELTDAELHAVTVTLARCGIYIAAERDAFGTLCVWAKQPVTTVEEVAVLGTFYDLTDARIDWHGAVADV